MMLVADPEWNRVPSTAKLPLALVYGSALCLALAPSSATAADPAGSEHRAPTYIGQEREANTDSSQFLTVPAQAPMFSAAVLTPRVLQASGTSDFNLLKGVTPVFWQNLSLIGAILLMLGGAYNMSRIASAYLTRRRAALEPAVFRHAIALADEGPARICRNPVASLDTIPWQAEWPSMTPVESVFGSPSPRREFNRSSAEKSSAAIFGSYRFYVLNQWGIVDSGTGGRFESDAAAIAHARRIEDGGQIEVWCGDRKLTTIDANRSGNRFAVDAERAFA